MANTSSARKAARVIARRTEVNKSRRSLMRNSVRKVEELRHSDVDLNRLIHNVIDSFN